MLWSAKEKMSRMRTMNRARLARVRFKCFTYEPWPMLVVGSNSELGNWDPGTALTMKLEAEVNGCREWNASIRCPLGEGFEFKFVGQSSSGPIWEVGDNRICSPDDRWIEIVDAFRG